MVKLFQAIVLCVVVISCRGAKADDTAQKWSPRNKYWRHLLKEQSGLDDGNGEHFGDMQSCVQTALSESNDVQLQDKTAVPTIVDTLTDSQNRTVLVEIVTPSLRHKLSRSNASQHAQNYTSRNHVSITVNSRCLAEVMTAHL
eukprot:scaffold6578_cov141-Skeletonema_marinoi.AAC.29